MMNVGVVDNVDTLDRVDVYAINGGIGGYGVYKTEDAEKLRAVHRILGHYIGTLGVHTNQNQVLALPLILSIEEVLLGSFEGFMNVYTDLPVDYIGGVDSDLKEKSFAMFREKRNSMLNEYLDSQKKMEMSAREKYESIKSRKRKRMEEESRERGRQRIQIHDSIFNQAVKRASIGLNRAVELTKTLWYKIRGQQPIQNGSRSLKSKYGIEVLSTEKRKNESVETRINVERYSNHFPVKTPVEHEHFEVPEESRRILLSFDDIICQTLQKKLTASLSSWLIPEICRFLVMRDLWKHGYYIGSGAKFGAHFMAYAGDPVAYHSALLIRVIPYQNAGTNQKEMSISSLDLISFGRLGTATKKEACVAYIDAPKNQFQFTYENDPKNDALHVSTMRLKNTFHQWTQNAKLLPKINYMGICWFRTLP
mmetsp:Transcript_4115/g.7229  ORF Transcript_4115/g.7229 Transcript_4115/m.7229 type:complete len:423 (-) Transcript_4115:1496-2764(-)